MTIPPLTYTEWRFEDGSVTASAEEARLRNGEPTRHEYALLPPGSRVRHASYQMLTGTLLSLDLQPMTTRPYVVEWDNPAHARIALGVEPTHQHPSKIRSLSEPVT